VTKFRFPSFSVVYDSDKYRTAYPATFVEDDSSTGSDMFCRVCGGVLQSGAQPGGVRRCECKRDNKK